MWLARDRRLFVSVGFCVVGVIALGACGGGDEPPGAREARKAPVAASAPSGAARSPGGAPGTTKISPVPDPASGAGGAPSARPVRAAPPPATPAPTVVKQLSHDVVMEQPEIQLPSRVSFQLLDPGKGPRAPLRYALAAGTAAYTTQTALTARHLDGGALTAPVALPAMRDGFAITVVGLRARQLALRILPAEAAAPGDTDAYLATWRTLLQNRRATIAFDDRGELSKVIFDDDPTNTRTPQAKDELLQRLLALTIPLPAEPVAPGASWRVITILRQGPAYAKQTATYSLVARAPTSWKLHVKLLRVAEEQRIADPSLPAGTTADLIALFRSFEGDVEIDPRYPLISSGSLALESRLHARIQPPGQSVIERVFEDLGTAVFQRCRASTDAASPAAGAPGAAFADCPAGFTR